MAASARSCQLQLLRLQTRSASSWLRRFIFGEEAPEAKVSVEQSPRWSLRAVALLNRVSINVSPIDEVPPGVPLKMKFCHMRTA